MSDHRHKSSEEAASKAGKVLQDDSASAEARSAAASTLSQTQGGKTGEEAASHAGKTLSNDKSSDDEKSAAGSALSQKD